MSITRANFVRGLGAGALLLPTVADAARSLDQGQFASELSGQDPHPWTAAPVGGKSPLRFAVIGDHTGIARPGVFEQGLKQVSWLQPDFILSVGDLIEGYTQDRDEIARQWAAVESSVASTGLPFVYACGNHDVDNAETLDAWRQRRGASYYSFTYKGALFIILNTEDTPKPMSDKLAKQFYSIVDMMKSDPDKAEQMIDGYIDKSGGQMGEYSALETVSFGDRQLGFVQRALAKYPHARWTFVVLHKPAWKMQSPEFAIVQAMLKDRPHTIFAGHTHYFTHEVFDGADYINMATTGGIRQKNGPGTMDHTMLVTLTANGPIFANQRLTGLMDVAGQTGQVRAY